MHDLEARLLAIEAELKDIRADAVGPVEKLAAELTALRHYADKLLATIRKSHKELSERIENMALDVSKLNDAATALNTAAGDLNTVAQQLPGILANASAADQAQLDTVVATIQTDVAAIVAGVAAVKAALPATPAPAPTPAPAA